MKRSDVNPSDGELSVTSTTLLHGARREDPDAWQELVHSYSRRMYRWCRVAGLQPADAANVVQEAFVAVARKLADFRRERAGDTFRGWLRRIVDNKIRDHYRGLTKRTDVALGGTDAQAVLHDLAKAPCSLETEGTDTTGGETGTEQMALLTAIDTIRQDVGERNWRLFWRVAVDGQSAAEAGDEFGVTANAVRIVKMRVLRRLRGELDERSRRPLPHE